MPSPVPLSAIITFTQGTSTGPADVMITGVAPLSDATETQLSFLSNPKYADQVADSKAAAILVANDHEGESPRFVRVANPYFAMASVVTRWFAERPKPVGFSPLAFIADTVTLGEGVTIGPFVSIGDRVVIGNDVTIYAHVTIEPDSVIGDGTILYPNVSIYYASRIGKRCILHSGVVIGSDGYGFAQHEGKHHKIPQIGTVRIEDDVELGAGTTVDRGALGETVIGEGTKIDNLVQIGHNVKIGKHCLLVSQVGIAGSTELGDYVVVAGQSGFAGHLKIGARAQVAAKSAVLRDVPPDMKVMGNPAIAFGEFSRREVWLRRLPELARKLTQVERLLVMREKR